MGALDGVRVIDLTRVLGGPFCTQWLGDHGADVIKVEPPQGDEVRHWGPPFDEEIGAASYFLGINRNKRGMALDLRTDQGREVLLKLIETADVLIENYKPGSMEKWGIGYDVLSARFPRLIHCRISGFGSDGPLGGLPGYDAVIQAQAGLMSVNGVPGGEPTRLGIPIVDIATGMSAMIGICMALYEREQSGQGQYIDATLYDTAVSVLFPHYANYFLSGKHPAITGNNHPNLSPYDVYPTRTSAVFVAGGNDGQFRKMCTVLGVPDAADDQRFATNSARLQHQSELRALLEPLLRQPRRRGGGTGSYGSGRSGGSRPRNAPGDRRAPYAPQEHDGRDRRLPDHRKPDQDEPHPGEPGPRQTTEVRGGDADRAGRAWLFRGSDRRNDRGRRRPGRAPLMCARSVCAGLSETQAHRSTGAPKQ